MYMYNQSNNSGRSQSSQSGRGSFRPRFQSNNNRGGYGGGGFNNSRRRPKQNNLDISLFINAAKAAPVVAEHVVEKNFVDFPLHESLLRNIVSRGYETPTPIQDQAIQSIIDGKDLLGIANTGTGKTGAFLIPIINKILHDFNNRVLIMVPTRELALQINRELRSLTEGLGIYSVLCIGGTSMYNQQRDLQRRFQFIIGTPGRLKDLINRNQLRLSDFRTVVLDEVDQMLDMGFIHDMREILQQMPREKQSLFFSATMTKPVQHLIGEFSHDLVTVSVKTVETAATIEQDVVHFDHPEKKIQILHDLLDSEGFNKVLIFGRTKRGVHKLSQTLNDRGFRAESIHGNKSQPQRQRALKMFQYNEVKILVATDVAARGLDIVDVTHVINYDMPESYEDYVHRIGRTGRANKKGKALTFVGRE